MKKIIKITELGLSSIYKFADNRYIMTREEKVLYKNNNILKRVTTVFELTPVLNIIAKGDIVGMEGHDINTDLFKIVDPLENEYQFPIRFPIREINIDEAKDIMKAVELLINDEYQAKEMESYYQKKGKKRK